MVKQRISKPTNSKPSPSRLPLILFSFHSFTHSRIYKDRFTYFINYTYILYFSNVFPFLSLYRLTQSVRESLEAFNASGKFVVLRLLLEKILFIGEFSDIRPISSSSTADSASTGNKPSKVVIFSQHPAILDLIVSQVLCHYEGLHYVLLSSSQSPQQRMQLIDNFQQQDHIRLLLTTTGVAGHGFTLTAASNIILVDHNYNPFVDMQAIDRCHRIGQTESLQIYRLVSNEPNEARVMNLQRFKEYIATMVIKTDNQAAGESAVMREVLGSSIQSWSGEKRKLEVVGVLETPGSNSSSSRKEEQYEEKRTKQECRPEKYPTVLETVRSDITVDKMEDTTTKNAIESESDGDEEEGFEIYE